MARKQNQRPATLTRSELLQRALAIVDAEGLPALTMRRLARDLNVEAASLYNHVSSKQDLLDGVLGLVRSEMRLPEEWPNGWTAQLETVLLEYYRVLAAHPNMMPLAGRRLEDTTDSGLLFLIEDEGFSAEDAVEIWQALVAFVVGFATFGSLYAETGTTGLPAQLGARVAEWREETVAKTLRIILDGHVRASERTS